MGEGRGKGSNGPRKYNCINNWGGGGGGNVYFPCPKLSFLALSKPRKYRMG